MFFRKLSIAILTYFLLFSISPIKAEPYKTITVKEYVESLQMPDADTSCCGVGDAYVVDHTEACTSSEKFYIKSESEGKHHCVTVAVLAEQPPEWKKYQHKEIPKGARIIVPNNKIRHPLKPNPLDFTIVFTNSVWFPEALCYEPIGGF